jgi:hypothetical protein
MKLFKTIIVIVLFLGIIILIGASYVKFFLPDISIRDISIDITQERIERGRYLANHVMLCIDCHSTRDWTKYPGPIITGTEGMGGEIFDQKQGFPGIYYATNITPYELGKWSDGEIYRALTAGVGNRNNALFPVMPFHIYGNLDDEDIFSIIAYLRTIPEIKNDLPPANSDFPMNFIINTFPKEGNPQNIPPRDNLLRYGEYMTLATDCMECHTEVDKMGRPIMEIAYAGGRKFFLPNGDISISTNITPDAGTGIGDWDEDKFIKVFKTYDLGHYEPPEIMVDEFNTIMPWTAYAGLDTFDLKAIYYYLRSIKPIEKSLSIE